jgi:hypothetical protein
METSSKLVQVGMSQNPDSMQAGAEAAKLALAGFAPNQKAGWALAFCGGRHDPAAVWQGLQAELGQIPIIGGAAIGVITNNSLSYTAFECAVAVFSASLPQPTILTVDDLGQGEIQAGQQLGARLREAAHEGDTVLLFYDSLCSGPPPVLYVGSRLLDGIYRGLNGKSLELIGAGTIGDYQFSQSFIFDGCQGVKHAVVAAVLPSLVRSQTAVMHGCVPASAFLEITRIEDAVVYELDGRPALDVLMEMLGGVTDDPLKHNLSLTLTLGEKHGDLYAPYDESAYVNRLILASNPADGSVTLFEADFAVGSKVQVMSRDNQLMLESVQRQTGALLDSLPAATPFFAFYIDCAGRTCAFSGADMEEASLIQAKLPQDIPLLGFYSGVEIAPLMGRSRPLDWTGVLTVLMV